MKNYIIQLLIIISFCFSQTLEIYVFNQNNNVLENSNIIITNSKNVDKGGSTDVNGRYIFNTINQDNYIITVSHIGYENYKKELNVNRNKKYKLNVILNNKSILIPELKIISDTNASYQKLAGSATVIETRKLKQIDPKVTTVTGGLHTTLYPECILETDKMDAVFMGESEYSFLEFSSQYLKFL